MNKRIAIASLFALLVTACGGTSDDTNSEPIKLGYIGPLTGDAASYGSDTLNGMKLKVAEVNNAGGINGRMIEIIAEDGRCAGAESASAAQKLVHIDKVIAIVGGQCSGETLAAAPIAEAAGVPVVSPVSSSPDVTSAGDFIFRVFPSDALKTVATKKYFESKGYEKVAMIGENTDFTSAFRDSLKEKLGEEAFVLDELLEPGTKDYRSVLTRLADAEVDVIFANANSDAVMAAIMSQVREQGLEQEIVTHDAGDSVTLLELAAGATDNFHFINTPSVGEGGTFQTAFEAEFGAPPNIVTFAAHAYDAVSVLIDALDAGAPDGAAIRDHLYNLRNFKGVAGTFRFDDNGDVLGIPFVLKGFEGDKIVTIEEISVD